MPRVSERDSDRRQTLRTLRTASDGDASRIVYAHSRRVCEKWRHFDSTFLYVARRTSFSLDNIKRHVEWIALLDNLSCNDRECRSFRSNQAHATGSTYFQGAT